MSSGRSHPNSPEAQSSLLLAGKRHQLLIKEVTRTLCTEKDQHSDLKPIRDGALTHSLLSPRSQGGIAICCRRTQQLSPPADDRDGGQLQRPPGTERGPAGGQGCWEAPSRAPRPVIASPERVIRAAHPAPLSLANDLPRSPRFPAAVQRHKASQRTVTRTRIIQLRSSFLTVRKGLGRLLERSRSGKTRTTGLFSGDR